MNLTWSGDLSRPSSLRCQVLRLMPIWLKNLEVGLICVSSVSQKPVCSVPEVPLSQTLNLVAWRRVLCLLYLQRVRRKQDWVTDLSWLEGRARPSPITPQYCSPGHHAAMSLGFMPSRSQLQKFMAEWPVGAWAHPRKSSGVCFWKRML